MDVYCIVNQTVKLSVPTRKTQLQTPLAYNNTLAHCMRVTVVNEDGTDADLTGVGVTASVLMADGQTVEPINGTASGNVAEVILPASCYLVPGRFKFTMNLHSSKPYPTDGIDEFSTSTSYAIDDLCVRNGVVYRFIHAHSGAWSDADAVIATIDAARTILWVEGYIERNTTTQIIDPGTPVPNITQAIGNANAAAATANAAATDATEAAQAALDAAAAIQIATVAETEEYLVIT